MTPSNKALSILCAVAAFGLAACNDDAANKDYPVIPEQQGKLFYGEKVKGYTTRNDPGTLTFCTQNGSDMNDNPRSLQRSYTLACHTVDQDKNVVQTIHIVNNTAQDDVSRFAFEDLPESDQGYVQTIASNIQKYAMNVNIVKP